MGTSVLTYRGPSGVMDAAPVAVPIGKGPPRRFPFPGHKEKPAP